ncbi:MAG: hypothetical protein K8F25_15735 [Fimbriimonadaceae bacterium]|nr:hypothetical protein [Alphaproteobacteria bacterium]
MMKSVTFPIPRQKILISLSQLLLIAMIVFLGVNQSESHAATPFDTLRGAWRGSGKMNLRSGSAERLVCTAYYTGGGSRLDLLIRCAGETTKIEMLSNLTSSGSRLKGSWEERTFNAQGSIEGQITGDLITMAITGLGDIRGRMSVSFTRSKQEVSIFVEGIGLKSVDLKLSRQR